MSGHPNLTTRKKPPDKSSDQEVKQQVKPEQQKETFASKAKAGKKKKVATINWIAGTMPEIKCRWYRVRDKSQKLLSTLRKRFRKNAISVLL